MGADSGRGRCTTNAPNTHPLTRSPCSSLRPDNALLLAAIASSMASSSAAMGCAVRRMLGLRLMMLNEDERVMRGWRCYSRSSNMEVVGRFIEGGVKLNFSMEWWAPWRDSIRFCR